MSVRPSPPQAFRFRTSVADKDEREARVSAYEAQGTMGRRQKTGEALFLLRLPLRTNFSSIERRLETRQLMSCAVFYLPHPRAEHFHMT